ncbi:beta-ketoacyl synthase N-terminal-like domain-containing protein [Streptomyces triticirhizae]|uniref:beta-ketoacyl synthase N-terminal-like domain-containing protein n=1 Tax=Streptomyces triticirhizae TaxID=2483353 RepID=UPI001F2EAB94|nr:beta-ketoacyl synthase N-terminal-like domain-containing protein [Streptomyces triticirhizae]
MTAGTEAVVTGMAWATPLGDGLQEVWRRLCSGATGVADQPSPHRLRTERAAAVPSPPYRPGGREAWERQVALAARTMDAALRDAGVAADHGRLTLVPGTSFDARIDREAPEEDWAVAAARQLGHPRRPLVVTTACSAGADSLLLALALLREGGGEGIFLAGGVDVLTEAKRLGHSALGTMSPTGLRAFDVAHDGMTLGEGAGFLVLEGAAAARRRGARVYATLSGAGSANDAFGLTAPDPSGRTVTAAVRRALAGSGGVPGDVAVICAHGTGTPANDEVEAATVQRLFGGVRSGPVPVVFGTKGALGHSLGATGAIEAVATVLALRERQVPPLHGLSSPLPGLSLRLPRGGPEKAYGTRGISLTLGFGGFNTCLLFDSGPPAGDAGDGAATAVPAGPASDPPLAVAGHATLRVTDPASHTRDKPSFYADPVAWLIVSAVEEALAPCREEALAEPDEVAVLVTHDGQALPTHRRIARDAARGRVSPLRFAGSNPGILAGLTCLTLGLRGPSLVLEADPADAGNAGTALVGDWLRTGRARYVLWAAHRADGDAHTATCVVLRPGTPDDDGADGAGFARQLLTDPPTADAVQRP